MGGGSRITLGAAAGAVGVAVLCGAAFPPLAVASLAISGVYIASIAARLAWNKARSEQNEKRKREQEFNYELLRAPSAASGKELGSATISSPHLGNQNVVLDELLDVLSREREKNGAIGDYLQKLGVPSEVVDSAKLSYNAPDNASGRDAARRSVEFYVYGPGMFNQRLLNRHLENLGGKRGFEAANMALKYLCESFPDRRIDIFRASLDGVYRKHLREGLLHAAGYRKYGKEERYSGLDLKPVKAERVVKKLLGIDPKKFPEEFGREYQRIVDTKLFSTTVISLADTAKNDGNSKGAAKILASYDKARGWTPDRLMKEVWGNEAESDMAKVAEAMLIDKLNMRRKDKIEKNKTLVCAYREIMRTQSRTRHFLGKFWPRKTDYEKLTCEMEKILRGESDAGGLLTALAVYFAGNKGEGWSKVKAWLNDKDKTFSEKVSGEIKAGKCEGPTGKSSILLKEAFDHLRCSIHGSDGRIEGCVDVLCDVTSVKHIKPAGLIKLVWEKLEIDAMVENSIYLSREIFDKGGSVNDAKVVLNTCGLGKDNGEPWSGEIWNVLRGPGERGKKTAAREMLRVRYAKRMRDIEFDIIPYDNLYKICRKYQNFIDKPEAQVKNWINEKIVADINGSTVDIDACVANALLQSSVDKILAGASNETMSRAVAEGRGTIGQFFPGQLSPTDAVLFNALHTLPREATSGHSECPSPYENRIGKPQYRYSFRSGEGLDTSSCRSPLGSHNQIAGLDRRR